jgi:hypothetical protein
MFPAGYRRHGKNEKREKAKNSVSAVIIPYIGNHCKQFLFILENMRKEEKIFVAETGRI